MILANSLTTPALGLIVWTTLIFLIFFLLLYRYAWPQILNALHARNDRIRSALLAAEEAREEMIKLQADNEAILRKAREEREAIVREARDSAERIIGEAKGKAIAEANLIIAKSKTAIEREKAAAMSEIRQQVASISLDIASRVLLDKLSGDKEQEKLIEKYLNELDSNRN
jgi:F-type H+-transporting ATPase subunit b